MRFTQDDIRQLSTWFMRRGLEVISSTISPPLTVIRQTTVTNTRAFVQRIRAASSGNMADEFGPSVVLAIQDDAAVSNDIAQVAAVRSGADNSGALAFITYLAGVATERMRIGPNGRVGIGTTTPTARLHLPGGTATASTAPLKLTSGTVLGTPEAGAVEYNGAFHVTESSGTRRYVVQSAHAPKVTAAAPYTNDGYIIITINGTDYKILTTA